MASYGAASIAIMPSPKANQQMVETQERERQMRYKIQRVSRKHLGGEELTSEFTR
jgi:hypothetical protein